MRVPVSVIEDDASLRQILADWINSSDKFTCLSEYPTAEDAITGLPCKRPAIALVDINLPRMSGVECVRRLKPLMPETQFVMLTVYEDPEHIFEALAAGAIGYLLKRITCGELIASLEQVVSGGAPMTSYIARKVVQSFHSLPPDSPRSDVLSPREWQVLELLAKGYMYKEITDILGVSMSTVNTHIRRIYDKLHVHSRTQAIAKLKAFTHPQDRV